MMEQVELSAKNLYFLGKEYESKFPAKFTEMFGEGKGSELSLHLKLVTAGLAIVAKLGEQVDKLPESKKAVLPVAQIAAIMGVMKAGVATPSLLRASRIEALKREEASDDAVQDRFNESIEDSGLNLEESMKALSDTDGGIPDYFFDAFPLTDLESPASAVKGPDLDDDGDDDDLQMSN